MTLIEILDKDPIENMVSCIALRPDKVLFIGEAAELCRQIPVYTEFAEKRHYKTEFLCRAVDFSRIDSTVTAVTEALSKDDDCVFDLTGGDDLGLVALGIALERLKNEKRVRVHRFDIKKSIAVDCDGDGDMPYRGSVAIGVNDSICLYGGLPIYPSNEFASPSDWVMSEKVTRAVATVWELCRQNPQLWNTSVTALKEFEKYRTFVDNPMRVVVTSRMSGGVKNRADKLKKVKRLLEKLSARGLVTSYETRNGEFSYTYGSAYAKHCLEKAGNILEIKMLMLAREIKNGDGSSYFTDARTGVSIDWNTDSYYSVPTCNEIDVILMRGLVPVFISCKNGSVGDDELYKLHTVAERFGGRYAKKVLVASEIPKSQKSLEYFMRRAEDMNITVINDVYMMSDEQIKNKLRALV